MIVNAKFALPEINVLLIALDYALEHLGEEDPTVNDKMSALIRKLENLLPGDEYTIKDAMEDMDNVF